LDQEALRVLVLETLFKNMHIYLKVQLIQYLRYSQKNFGAFVTLGFLIAFQAPDLFGKLLAAGIVSFIGIQAFVNIASQVVLIPLTGVPLPFISYGGTSLIINLVSVGILLSIARRDHKKEEKKLHRRLIKKF
jgi:hypothetical protein